MKPKRDKNGLKFDAMLLLSFRDNGNGLSIDKNMQFLDKKGHLEVIKNNSGENGHNFLDK